MGNNNECVLLNSGGIDSRVVAGILKKQNWLIHSLHIGMNHHNIEAQFKAAENTSKLYCVSHKTINFGEDWVIGKKGLPFTGLFVHVLGGQYADVIGVEYVFSGSKKDGLGVNYLPELSRMLTLSAITEPVILDAPLFHKTFDEVIGIANELGIPLSDTHSCWTFPACGMCGKCNMRKKIGL